VDVERELTRVLRTVDVPPAADPVPAVRAGMRHRRRVRRVQAAAAALAVVGMTVGASALLTGTSPRDRTTHLPGASITSEPTTEPTAAPTTAPTNAGVPEPTQYPDPTYTRAVDLSWVSVDHGFALTVDSCVDGPCSHLRRTTDGGRTWSDVGATGLPGACSTACPFRVRFANRDVGYVYGNGLVMTTDGGRTWTRQPGPDTHGLEIAGGTAVRVVEGSACPGCAFEVQRSDVGSDTWRTVQSSKDVYAAADLVRQGDDIVVNLKQNPAGGADDAHSTLLVSADAGTTWASRDDPCGGTRDTEADASQLAWSQDGKLVVLCQRRLYKSNGGNATILLSSDGGRTFSRPTGFGEVTDVFLVAVGNGVLLAETHYGIDHEVLLQRSTDDGQTWTEVARAPLPDGTPTGYLAFSTSQVVTWAPPSGTEVRRSTDAGKTWTTYELP
jgi:photosystem II stability/assembly factor-like uncharacterized protein